MNKGANLYHTQINISNPEISIPFYKDLLLYFGYKIIDQGKDYIGFTNNINDFWFIGTESNHKSNFFHRKNTGINHIAFIVDSKESVDEFYKDFLLKRKIAVLYGSPKKFPEYTEDYYAVFFECPDRLKLEVAFRSFKDEQYKLLIWHSKKCSMVEKVSPQFSEREVWWCSIGSNVGFEEDGKGVEFERPILILKKFNKHLFIGVPMTSKQKEGKYYFPYPLEDKKGSFILSQARPLSVKRLNRRISKIAEDVFEQIKDKYVSILES